jgi:hypothetical protein
MDQRAASIKLQDGVGVGLAHRSKLIWCEL